MFKLHFSEILIQVKRYTRYKNAKNASPNFALCSFKSCLQGVTQS